MNTTELKELARTLNGIADGKPWQIRQSNASQWEDAREETKATSALFYGYQIRLKPWELGPEVNGHKLPEGKEWMRPEKWTEERLPFPFRPLMIGEYQLPEDEEFCHGKIIHSQKKVLTCRDYNPVRTTRPIVDPYAELKAAQAVGKVIQFCNQGEWINWVPDWTAPVEEYRIKPELVEFGPEDISPGSVLKGVAWKEDDSNCWRTVNGVSLIGVTIQSVLPGSAYSSLIGWKDLKKHWLINRSISLSGKWNPNTWEPCEKEV